MIKRYFFLTTLLVFIQTKAQEIDSLRQDSLHYNSLKEVVLTGQYNRQSVDKSVFEVEVLSQKDIKMLAANNLADVLNQTLNMNIVPQAGEGRSGIKQFGFNSEYVKILVDNVPIVGDEGFGNAIDISQINLDDIEQIEIIEGSMGVQYGADAVTGVVNIITKKSGKHDWQITPFIQEETIGNEYSFFDEGRHIQSIKIGHNFSDELYGNILYTRNDFQGFLNNKKGISYYNRARENDSLRGYEWLPKEQNNIKALLNFTDNKNFKAFYKFEYFTEETNKYANNANSNYNPSTETINPTANDEIFTSERFYHHLNTSGKINEKVNFNISAAYQEQIKNYKRYSYRLKTEEKNTLEQYDYNTRKGFFSRGTFNNFFDSDKANIELGYETTIDAGSASGLASQNIEQRTKSNQLNSYSFFASSELEPFKNLSIRPGARVIFSSKFNPIMALSLSGKYRFKNNYQLRAIVGSAPKIPNYEQLYFYLVDSNHNVQGNENLNAEYGKSIFLHLKKNFWSKNYELKFTPKLSLWFLDVKDKIDLIVIQNAPLAYQYNNIDLYRTWGTSLRNSINYNQFTATLGVGFSGQSKILKSAGVYNDDYLYAFQINSNLSYNIPKWNTTFSTYFKYNGPQQQFFNELNDERETVVKRGKIEGYGWLNASVRKTFFDTNFEVTLGARNMLDITQVNTSVIGGGTHETSTGSQLFGYGRSYFIKLLYNLNF
ncbi:TonB-dependent receptor plug domain-containing protein [Mesonia maritima]|uniref:Outer membrane receptor for ferrienterochelin and colicins n=1 Tax=Mesonia maritima TaxID=1793873 RepID=A0ABU1K465_9FLAO|nr:TonB-dependent receptor [Mesonia maritima]MDR6300410.1 outer membrane receptor for ferrienterochelin and colicins [Mesonia maritima]